MGDVKFERKYGRNEPCPCGSGKKYKKCCIESHKSLMAEVAVLDNLSNSVPDLIAAHRLEEAEKVSRQLLKQYPDQPDGLYRLADVYFAKGEYKKAADYYNQTVIFCEKVNKDDPGAFDQGMIDEYKDYTTQALRLA